MVSTGRGRSLIPGHGAMTGRLPGICGEFSFGEPPIPIQGGKRQVLPVCGDSEIVILPRRQPIPIPPPSRVRAIALEIPFRPG
jgi:hypothetical protein